MLLLRKLLPSRVLSVARGSTPLHVVSSHMEDSIKARLPALLHSCDWDRTSERDICTQLSQELGATVVDHKPLIKVMIEDFLAEKAATQEPENPMKRKADDTSSMQKASKKASTTGGGDYVLDLSDNGSRKCAVRTFKGKVQLDLREYYEDKSSGELKPGPKGISLSFEQWMVLKPQLAALSDALDQRQAGGEPVMLSADRQAYVSEFKGKFNVHVREMYEKDGKVLPGKKGVVLSASCLDRLIEFADEVTAEAQRRGGAPPAAAAAAAAAAPASAPRSAAAAPSAAARPMKENIQAAPVRAGSASGASSVDLGSDKRASVTSFKGKTYVDLREYYSSGAEKLPGKKGIMLSPSEFRLLAQNHGAIAQAFSSCDTQFEVDLGAKRKVTISEFKGKTYVGVREFYEAGGVLKPGAKGLSLNTEQWQKLSASLGQLENALSAL